MRSEVACRTSSHWQGLPLVWHSGRTQSNHSQCGSGKRSQSELRRDWSARGKIVIILPKKKVETRTKHNLTDIPVQVCRLFACLVA